MFFVGRRRLVQKVVGSSPRRGNIFFLQNHAEKWLPCSRLFRVGPALLINFKEADMLE